MRYYSVGPSDSDPYPPSLTDVTPGDPDGPTTTKRSDVGPSDSDPTVKR